MEKYSRYLVQSDSFTDESELYRKLQLCDKDNNSLTFTAIGREGFWILFETEVFSEMFAKNRLHYNDEGKL